MRHPVSTFAQRAERILEATIPLDATIVFEAQRHMVAIKMQCRDFVKLERPERLTFAKEPVQAARSHSEAR